MTPSLLRDLRSLRGLWAINSGLRLVLERAASLGFDRKGPSSEFDGCGIALQLSV